MRRTPRTDAKERETRELAAPTHAHYGWKHARALERELAAANEANAALRAEVERLREDADRYRWLASRARKDTAYDRYEIDTQRIRADVDAELKAAEKPKPKAKKAAKKTAAKKAKGKGTKEAAA